jgi:hypothetical protein
MKQLKQQKEDARAGIDQQPPYQYKEVMSGQ